MPVSQVQLQKYLDVIFGSFNKAAPGLKVQNVIWQQVGHLPEPFFEWAAYHISQNDEKLPANMGKYLSQDLWYEWRAQNSQLKAHESRGCPDCLGKSGIAGQGFYCFGKDEEGIIQTYFVPCHCGYRPKASSFKGLTRTEAQAQGLQTIPNDFQGGVLDYELFLKYGIVPEPTAERLQRRKSLKVKAGEI